MDVCVYVYKGVAMQSFLLFYIYQCSDRIQFSTTQVTFQMASTYDLWQFVYQIAQPEYFHKVQSWIGSSTLEHNFYLLSITSQIIYLKSNSK